MKSAFAFKEEFDLIIQYDMKSYLSGDEHHFTSLSVKRVPSNIIVANPVIIISPL